MKKGLLFCALIAVLFSSCSKDEVEITPTKANLVGTYMMTGFTVTQNGVTVNAFNNADEAINWYEPCDRDDRYQLHPDMAYQVLDAGTVCSPDDNNYTATWNYINTRSIEIDGVINTIKSFNGTMLVIEEQGQGAVYTTTFKKQ
jgi:hypothetical protein